MEPKRKSCNFTKPEIDVLVAAVECHKNLIFGKLSSALTSDMKRTCWRDITDTVNAVSGGAARTEKAVKKKWTDMCSLIKKKEAARRREMNVTGGGENSCLPLSSTELQVVALLADEAIEGVCGGTDVGIVKDDVLMDIPADLPLPGCSSDDNIVSQVEVVVADTVRTKMAADGKQRREKSESGNIEELTRLEKRRLDVEEERLAVEKRRLAVEEERLKLEQERWQWMKSLSTPVVFADE